MSAWELTFGGNTLNFSDSTHNVSGGVVTYTWDTPGTLGTRRDIFY